MFHHLLVPLDGSYMAEAVLPTVQYLARRLGATVTLIHCIEEHAPEEVHGDRHLSSPAEAEAYLQEVSRRFAGAGLKVHCHVHAPEVGSVAKSILDHFSELQPDLVILSTHGPRGPRRWLFGSIAQQVTGGGTTPVLVVRASSSGDAPPFECRRVLVLLDGNPEHEQGIDVAADLAQACSASLHLVMVVETFGTLTGARAATSRLMPGATSVVLDMAEEGAGAYLQGHLSRLSSSGIQATAEVARGAPIDVIEASARSSGADLVVMGTHGKVGMDAFWSESLTPRLFSRLEVPILLVPVR
jgi:nucleotide-binding universal stress UspA family protein